MAMELDSNSSKIRRKRTTLQDVAGKAGVSVQTASHVLTENPTARITETTRERVRMAAIEVGYQPNRMAQAMRRGRTNIIAVWMPVDRVVTHHLEQLQLLGKLARGSNYELMVIGLESNVAYGIDWKLPSQWPVDGIISIDAGRALRRFRESSDDHSIPLCVLGNEDLPNADSVAWDLIGASCQLAADLVDSGRRHLWHLTPAWVLENYPKEQRHNGFTQGCLQAGGIGHLIPTESEGVEHVLEALDKAAAVYGAPQGITCFSDDIAVAAAWWLDRKGVAIPSDCEVWGYSASRILDAIPFQINSLRVPYEEISRQAWEWLLDRVENPDQPTLTRLIDVQRTYHSGFIPA